MTEDEMVGWHHWLDGYELEQAPGVGDGQGDLVCCRPWDFPGKNTGVGCHFLLQGTFLTQGSNPGLLHCRQTLYLLRKPRWPKYWSFSFSISLSNEYTG